MKHRVEIEINIQKIIMKLRVEIEINMQRKNLWNSA